jgi:hypothetical protein
MSSSAPFLMPRPIDLRTLPPALTTRETAPRRTRIWEFNTNLHCSIIGTCLTTGELRSVLRKLGKAPEGSTDHELHGIAVSLASRHDEPARRLHKALDHAHKLAISQFGKASTADAIRALWRDALRRGDVPGAYWATLTHEAATREVIRDAFGDVHMLSHLVGAANRADIRRLCVLEADRAALAEKLEHQQQTMHDALVTRDQQIEALRAALAERPQAACQDTADDIAALRALAAERERRLEAETGRRLALEEKLAATQHDAALDRSARLTAEREAADMRRDLEAVEASLAAAAQPDDSGPRIRLRGQVLLYVGGRPNQVAQMRMTIERLGGTLLHHDGGVENHPNLLPGLTSRADLVLFPVDCISHDAANSVKVLCRQSGKRFIPLRSASMTSLLAALHAGACPPIGQTAA